MTSHQDQIQALISEIDEVLGQPSPRLPWVAFGETVTRARHVLERVRKYLVSLQQEIGDSPRSLRSPVSADFSSIAPSQQQDVWQALREEMGYLRSQLTELLQTEVEELRRERQRLVREIRTLEVRREEDLTQLDRQPDRQQLIAEFLQELMNRLQESLTQRVTETLSNLEEQVLNAALAGETVDTPPRSELQRYGRATSTRSDMADLEDELETSKLLPRLTPAQRLEQMRMLQAQSDHLLIALDSSLSVIFEALQSNLQTYQESLSQNIEKMHSLGKQGEVIFSAWIEHLTRQLSEATTTQLQSSLQLPESEPTTHPPRESEPTTPDEELTESPIAETPARETAAELDEIPVREVSPPDSRDEKDVEDVGAFFPFAGVELPLPRKVSKAESEEEIQEPSFSEETDLTDEGEFDSFLDETEYSIDEASWEAEDLFPEEEAESEGEITAETAVEVSDDLPEEEDAIAWEAEDLFPEEESDRTDSETDSEKRMLDTQDLFEDISEEEIAIERVGTLTESQNGSQPGESDEFSMELEWEQEPSLSETELLLENDDLFEEAMNQPDRTGNLPRQESTSSQASSFLDENTLEEFGNIFGTPELDIDEKQPLDEEKESSDIENKKEPLDEKKKSLNNEKYTEDRFIYASPHENLLPVDVEENDDRIDSQLLIDKQTLQQLEAELASLEGYSPNEDSVPDMDDEKEFDDEEFEVSADSDRSIMERTEQGTITLENLVGELDADRESPDRTEPSSPSQKEETEIDPFAGWDTSNVTLDDLLTSFDESETSSQNKKEETEETDSEGDFLSLEDLYQEMNRASPMNNSRPKKS